MGLFDQPDYVNAVAAFDTLLEPLVLLNQIQRIELEFGRKHTMERWGPRTLDLDILLFGDLKLNSELLTVPHSGIKVREFVLYPLAEIAPDLYLPDGSAIIDLVAVTDRRGLTTIE
ncbi:2-amino-4-hydroxy-6- hydroxymethyldihydropteridine pyrophosphokinase [Candidatus Enterovibrio escicola]|uniref:2-amino-4-hydroxy-6-hydroxymethyldihydropteridine pyrophosphokinase n=2 Tax=Candidatus Enterovibrio escicola TaxID=1927127 RepID=A0A2A5T068_9GAMM|nr:2-amino-4-hydroxy-6- hydroxymethyldihydropteridine pyrophosphokinase [Candidatus Enterovibrio escacola]